METGVSPNLADVLARHGERWQIGRDQETGAWTAVERPTPSALTVHVGLTLAQLEAKLDGEAGA